MKTHDNAATWISPAMTSKSTMTWEVHDPSYCMLISGVVRCKILGRGRGLCFMQKLYICTIGRVHIQVKAYNIICYEYVKHMSHKTISSLRKFIFLSLLDENSM